jgi:tetratricopeptide (TPR) repeat protein
LPVNFGKFGFDIRCRRTLSGKLSHSSVVLAPPHALLLADAPLRKITARRPDSADGWNELGHANRMLGDMENSFRNYAKALQLDPKHRDAHEYLGEAYLQVGDVSRAEQELRTLGSLCFLPCEQYSDLKEQVRRYKIEHSTAAR